MNSTCMRNFITSLLSCYRFIYIAGTVFNSFVSFLAGSLTILLFRQVVLTICVVFLCVFHDEVEEAKLDLVELQQKLVKSHWIFAYDSVIFLCCSLATFLVMLSNHLPFGIFWLSIGFIYSSFFVLYCVFRWYCISTTPAVKAVFKAHSCGSKNLLPRRRFSTQVIYTFKVLPEVGRVLAVGVQLVGGVVMGSVGITKFAYGYNARPAVVNFFSYGLNGITSPREDLFQMGAAIVEVADPLDKDVRKKTTEPGTRGQLSEQMIYRYMEDNFSKNTKIRDLLRKHHPLYCAYHEFQKQAHGGEFKTWDDLQKKK